MSWPAIPYFPLVPELKSLPISSDGPKIRAESPMRFRNALLLAADLNEMMPILELFDME